MNNKDILIKEAKDLVNKIYQPLGYLSCNVSNNKMWDYSKDRAIEITKHFITKMEKGSSIWLHHMLLIEEIEKL